MERAKKESELRRKREQEEAERLRKEGEEKEKAEREAVLQKQKAQERLVEEKPSETFSFLELRELTRTIKSGDAVPDHLKGEHTFCFLFEIYIHARLPYCSRLASPSDLYLNLVQMWSLLKRSGILAMKSFSNMLANPG